jgi:hypothetical protein
MRIFVVCILSHIKEDEMGRGDMSTKYERDHWEGLT